MTEGKNRIMIYGPNDDGTYVVEFRMAGGEALAISIPQSEARVIRHFQERMPHGLFVPEMKVWDDDMDIESVKTKLRQATSSLDEMRAYKRRVFGDNDAKFGKALSGFLGAGRSVVYLLEKMASYKTWRKEWNAENPSKDRLLKCIHDKRDTDVHEGSPGHTAKPGEEIKVGSGSSYSDESGKLEVWGPPGLDATISKRDYVFDVCGTERPVTEACAEYLAALEQMVAQFEADTSS
jgi:hypothetical protein